MNAKIEKLKNRLGGVTPAALIFSQENRLYFTGFNASDGALFVTDKGAVFYTDSRYTQAAIKALGEENVRNSADMYRELEEFFVQSGICDCSVENDRLTLSEFETLEQRLTQVRFNVSSDLSRIINDLRSIKTEEEVAYIAKAQSLAESAFDYILGQIRPGVTEKELQLSLDYYMLKNGAQALSFETIAVSGENSAMPHGVASDKPVQKGDFITFDFGAVINGYHSDMTRTVILGTPTLRQRQVYDTVVKAQLACLDSLKEGVDCAFADKCARDVIENAGFGKYFGHGTGHGVGVEIHEFPNLSPRSRSTLQSGNIVTVEPGIYLPGEFGVRIEDMAKITSSGCVNLTHASKELICL